MRSEANNNPKRVEKKAPEGANNGIALLLVVVIMAAMLTMSTAIFNAVYSQIIISGEMGDTLRAMYAADQSMEQVWYLDRVAEVFPTPGSATVSNAASLLPSACYTYTVEKYSGGGLRCNNNPDSNITTRIRAFGEFQCGNIAGARVVRRSFCVIY